MCPSIEKKPELMTSNANTVAHLITGLSDHLGEALEVAQAGEQESKRQLAVGESILTRVQKATERCAGPAG